MTSRPLEGRRLRVGYVSPDFREHPVASFLEPILASHDHQRVEVFCYSDVSHPDEVTGAADDTPTIGVRSQGSPTLRPPR